MAIGPTGKGLMNICLFMLTEALLGPFLRTPGPHSRHGLCETGLDVQVV